jgi:hypothetical protein
LMFSLSNDSPVSVKIFVAILLIAAVPAYAQAQSRSTPKGVQGWRAEGCDNYQGDKAKIKPYCEIQDLGEQMERAYEKRNLKLVDELLQKIDALEETLGPEYVALMVELQDIDPEKDKLGAEIMSVFEALDGLCTR